MTDFHGDLLLGGARLRELDGDIAQDAIGADESWHGEFRISDDRLAFVELGRDYLLVLADGRGKHVVLTDVRPEGDNEHSVVRFSSPGRAPK